MRFDDKNTREQRMESDRLAPISCIWNMFLNNCKSKYNIGSNATVDEQLLGYRGRCKFIHYIPTKPDKYGIKIFWLCDAENSYAVNGIVDTGKEPNQPRRMNYGRDVVMQLATPIYGTGRNVTFDNFFTSLDLAERLLSKRLTSVGTIRKNRKEVPSEFTPQRHREKYASTFGFRGNFTMVSSIFKSCKLARVYKWTFPRKLRQNYRT